MSYTIHTAAKDDSIILSKIELSTLAQQLKVGDIIFIDVPALPFQKISIATACWSNHVGIVTGFRNGEPIISESRFPLSGATTLSSFISRSKGNRIMAKRLNMPLSSDHKKSINAAAKQRTGILYDTGFNMHSKRQFCSRFVQEVLHDATGTTLGTVESLETLFKNNPSTSLIFWRLWYFKGIPWQRLTITPASLLNCKSTSVVFNGTATTQ